VAVSKNNRAFSDPALLLVLLPLEITTKYSLIVLITVNTKSLSRRLRHYMLPMTSYHKLRVSKADSHFNGLSFLVSISN